MLIEKQIPPVHQIGEPGPPEERTVSLSPLFLVETLRELRKTVGIIYNLALHALDKSDNQEEQKHLHLAMSGAYDQFISTVHLLSSYINVTSPIQKKNTVHCLLEEILETNEKKIDAKKIALQKTLADNLPETAFQDEQLRFLLNLILQYAILSTPFGGRLEIVTRFVACQQVEDLSSYDPLKTGGIEIFFCSSGHADPLSQPEGTQQLAATQQDDASAFILNLIREMIRTSQGMIDFQIDHLKSKTRMYLRLPIERRRLSYYRPANL